jgi:hypothetical protein
MPAIARSPAHCLIRKILASTPRNQPGTRPRSFFVSARRRFPSTIFAFVPRDRSALRRRSLAASANRDCFSSRANAASFSRNRFRAVARFSPCERESDTVTWIPLATCRSVTAVETLFTCCPPGPLDRENTSSISPSRHLFITAPCPTRPRKSKSRKKPPPPPFKTPTTDGL